MDHTIMRGTGCPTKSQVVIQLLASLDEYGVYWDEGDPEMGKAKDFLRRLRNSERLRKACLRIKRLNTIIELERKFQMGSGWAKINVFVSNEKIIDFLNSLRY